jgi:hypothetical protein
MSQMISGSSTDTARPMVSALSSMPGPDVDVTASEPPNEAPERRADGRDLVLGLERADAEPLVPGQLVQDVRGRGDRVRAEEQRQPGQLGRGHQAVGQRGVAADVPVRARRERGRLDLVRPRRPRWSRRSSKPAWNAAHVRRHDLRLAGELGLEEGQGAVRGRS